LEPSETGGLHIHVGSACTASGAHYWEGTATDPWLSTTWTSDANGNANIDLTTYPFLVLAQNSTFLRTVVVHSSTGQCVACVILDLSNKVNFVAGALSPYPGIAASDPASRNTNVVAYESGSTTITETIELSKRPHSLLGLDRLEISETGGIHIHENTRGCDVASGPHWYQGMTGG